MQVSPVLYSFPQSAGASKGRSSLDEPTPPSPCPSASSCSDLSFASDTDASATDYITTPPTSPTNKIDESFRRISIDDEVQQIRRSSEDGGSRSSNLNFTGHPRRGSVDSGLPSSFKASGPITSASLGKQPRTPSSSGSASPSPSLSAKRSRLVSPGTIDLSSLPRFPPTSPPEILSTDVDQNQSTGLNGIKTPQAAFTNGLFGSGSGSTPRALFPPSRPGLTSRWSTDSSGSDRQGDDSISPMTEMHPQQQHEEQEELVHSLESDSDSGSSTGGSSCTSDDCELCDWRRMMPSAKLSQGAFPGAIDEHEAEDADGEEDGEEGIFGSSSTRRGSADLARSASNATIVARDHADSPTSFGNHFRHSPSQNPYFASSAAFTNERILSPLPATSENSMDFIPPAPKPHQMGFSPFTEQPSPSVVEQLLPSPVTDMPHTSAAAEEVRVAVRKCRKCKRGRRSENFSSSSSSSTAVSSYSSDGTLSPSLIPADPPARLTRSQGLRIRDEGSSRPKGRYARVLSAQLHPSSLPSGSSGGDNISSSSTMKTASALLDGTVSPAATSSDPLRIRLREMPGARTPDSLPASPSPANAPHQLPSPSRALASYSLTAPPKIARTTSSSSTSSSGRGSNAGIKKSSWLAPAQASERRPSSPLHISTLAGESDDDASAEGGQKKGTRKTGDTRHDVFSRSFSFANLESPGPSVGAYIRSPLASPKTTMPVIEEADLVAAGEASSQNLNKVNPYFAGFI